MKKIIDRKLKRKYGFLKKWTVKVETKDKPQYLVSEQTNDIQGHTATATCDVETKDKSHYLISEENIQGHTATATCDVKTKDKQQYLVSEQNIQGHTATVTCDVNGEPKQRVSTHETLETSEPNSILLEEDCIHFLGDEFWNNPLNQINLKRLLKTINTNILKRVTKCNNSACTERGKKDTGITEIQDDIQHDHTYPKEREIRESNRSRESASISNVESLYFFEGKDTEPCGPSLPSEEEAVYVKKTELLDQGINGINQFAIEQELGIGCYCEVNLVNIVDATTNTVDEEEGKTKLEDVPWERRLKDVQLKQDLEDIPLQKCLDQPFEKRSECVSLMRHIGGKDLDDMPLQQRLEYMSLKRHRGNTRLDRRLDDVSLQERQKQRTEDIPLLWRLNDLRLKERLEDMPLKRRLEDKSLRRRVQDMPSYKRLENLPLKQRLDDFKQRLGEKVLKECMEDILLQQRLDVRLQERLKRQKIISVKKPSQKEQTPLSPREEKMFITVDRPREIQTKTVVQEESSERQQNISPKRPSSSPHHQELVMISAGRSAAVSVTNELSLKLEEDDDFIGPFLQDDKTPEFSKTITMNNNHTFYEGRKPAVLVQKIQLPEREREDCAHFQKQSPCEFHTPEDPGIAPFIKQEPESMKELVSELVEDQDTELPELYPNFDKESSARLTKRKCGLSEHSNSDDIILKKFKSTLPTLHKNKRGVDCSLSRLSMYLAFGKKTINADCSWSVLTSIAVAKEFLSAMKKCNVKSTTISAYAEDIKCALSFAQTDWVSSNVVPQSLSFKTEVENALTFWRVVLSSSYKYMRRIRHDKLARGEGFTDLQTCYRYVCDVRVKTEFDKNMLCLRNYYLSPSTARRYTALKAWDSVIRYLCVSALVKNATRPEVLRNIKIHEFESSQIEGHLCRIGVEMIKRRRTRITQAYEVRTLYIDLDYEDYNRWYSYASLRRKLNVRKPYDELLFVTVRGKPFIRLFDDINNWLKNNTNGHPIVNGNSIRTATLMAAASSPTEVQRAICQRLDIGWSTAQMYFRAGRMADELQFSDIKT